MMIGMFEHAVRTCKLTGVRMVVVSYNLGYAQFVIATYVGATRG